MVYDQQILKILSFVGHNGISVQMLAKHVYNMNCSLFSVPDMADIHHYVQQYLLRNSKSSQPLVESTGRRGFYRLNTDNSAYARQLVLEFQEEVENDTGCDMSAESKAVENMSLDLFVQ